MLCSHCLAKPRRSWKAHRENLGQKERIPSQLKLLDRGGLEPSTGFFQGVGQSSLREIVRGKGATHREA